MSPAEGFRPGRLWTLLDMLKVSAKDYIELGQAIADIQGGLFAHGLDIKENPTATLTEDEKTYIKNNLIRIFDHCINLHLDIASELIGSHSQIDTVPQTQREYNLLIETVFAELKTKLFSSFLRI